MKRFLIPVMVIFLMFSLVSGCGRKSTAHRGKVTLTLSCWEGPEGMVYLNKRIKQFEKLYPNIHVEVQQTPGNQYYQKLLIQSAGGSPPDIMQLAYDQLPRFAAKKTIQPLDELIERDNFPINGMFPELLPALRVKGVTYALPRGWTTFVIFYNKDKFRQAGVPFPKPGWTWDDFLSAAKKIQAKLPKGQFAFASESQMDSVAPWLWQNGIDYYDEKRSRSLLDTPEALETLHFLQDLVVKHRVAPLPSQSQDFGGPVEMFLAGRNAMTVAGRYGVLVFRPAKFEWDIAPMPRNKKDRTVLFCNTYVLRRYGPHVQEAWELMKFLTGEEGQRYQASVGRDMPSFISVAHSDVFLNPPGPKVNHRVFLDVIPSSRPLPVDVYSGEINELTKKKIQLILAGHETPEKAVGEIVPRINKLLREKWY